MNERWLIGSDNTILLPGLHEFDEERKQPENIVYLTSGVTVSGSLKDADGAAVATISAISYIAGTDGDWKIVIPAADMALTENEHYTADFTITAGGRSRQYKIARRAVYGR